MKQRAKMHVEEPHCASYSKYSDEEEEQVQMLRVRAPEHCIEAQVQDGDTLQAIALRFHCSISELKRLNHIDKDNEIFARRTIKVPVTPYSVLTQVLPGAPEPVPSTSNGITHEKPNQAPGDHIVDTILNSSIAPAVIPYTDGDSQETVEENTLLIQPPKRESVNEVIVKELTSHGADFGMKWFHLLSFVLVLGVAAPIIYVLFFLNKHHDVHSLHMVSQPPH